MTHITDEELVALYGTEGARIARDAITRSWQGIPFSERKPQEGERVLLWFADDEGWDTYKWIDDDVAHHGINDGWMTHWLPQPPAQQP